MHDKKLMNKAQLYLIDSYRDLIGTPGAKNREKQSLPPLFKKNQK